MNYYAKTDIGRVRTKNQDLATVIANSKNQILAVVCDGMGGHKAGEIASRVVMDHVVGCFKVNPYFLNEEEVLTWIAETIAKSNEIIKKMAHSNPDHEGMGTTIVLAIVFEDMLYISHVGDSRAYYCTEDSIVQITKDHTLVNALIDQGVITKEEAKHHSQKNVLIQVLGASDKIEPSIYSQKFEDGKLLLCSDGLYNTVSEKIILQIVNRKEDTKQKIIELIDEANANGGHDNIGITIIEVEGGQVK